MLFLNSKNDFSKRAEGAPFGDGTAPTTTTASPPIITQQATVLTAAKSVVCGAKAWLPDTYIAQVKAKYFNASIVDFSTLDLIYKYIDTARHNKNSYVIRYDLIDPTATRHIRRLALDKPDAKKNLHDTPKHWVMFDIDTVKTPYDVTKEPLRAIEWFIENKAPMLKNVGMVWQLSSSRGHKKNDVYDLSVHFFVLLKTARTGAQVKAWCIRDAHGIFDLNMFDKPQPHFTADPILTQYDDKDLCVLRDGLIGGGVLDMPLVIETVKEAKPKKQYSTHQQKQIATLTATGAYRTPENRQDAFRHLENSCNRIKKAMQGNRSNTVHACAYNLYGYVDAGILTDYEITNALFSAAQSTGLTAQQIDSQIDSGRQKHKPYTPPNDYIDDFETRDPSDPRPLYTTKTAFFNITTQNDDNELLLPRNVDDCIEAITATTDPIHSVKLFVWCLFIAAHGNPHKYDLNSVIARLGVLCGESVHPSTIKAAIAWAWEIVATVKARALESITISDHYKQKHIYTQTDDLGAIVYLPKARCQVLKAAMGTGKTSIYAKMLSDDCKKKGLTFLTIAHLSSLVSELSNVLKTDNYAKITDIYSDTGQEVKALSCVINSIVHPRFTQIVEKTDVLVIDEGVQGLRALVAIYNEQTSVYGSSKGIYNPNDVYMLLVQAIRKAGRVVIADACANDELMDWLESILDGECIEIIEHSAQSGTGINVNYNFGNNRDCAISAGLADLKEALKNGSKIWVTVESAKVGKLIKTALDPLAKVFYLHKKTPTKQKTQFLSDVENESLKYDVVIVSPVIKSGISVTHKNKPHFDKVFYIGDGSTCSPIDTLQMIRRVRYVKDVQLYTWVNYVKVGDSTRLRTATDFYTLKNKLQNAITWERHNFNASLFYCLKETGFNVVLRGVKGDIKETRGFIEVVNETTVNELNNAIMFESKNDYKSALFNKEKTDDDWNAIDAYELREHLAMGDTCMTLDDLKLWQDGRVRETLARRAAFSGIALKSVEHSHILVELIQQIFKGVDALNITLLDKETAQKIVDNAMGVGMKGAKYFLLPDTFRRKTVTIKEPFKTAINIFKRCLSVTLSPLLLEQSGESVTTSRAQKRFYSVNQESARHLDAIIERLTKSPDPTTTPLKDTIKERVFMNSFDDVEPIEDSFENMPLFAQSVEHLDVIEQNIDAANDKYHVPTINAYAEKETVILETLDELPSTVKKIPPIKVTCQKCVYLTPLGQCKLKAQKPRFDSRAMACNSFAMIYHTRDLISAPPPNEKGLKLLFNRNATNYINHARNCDECFIEQGHFCMDGHRWGEKVLEFFELLNDAALKDRFYKVFYNCFYGGISVEENREQEQQELAKAYGNSFK